MGFSLDCSGSPVGATGAIANSQIGVFPFPGMGDRLPFPGSVLDYRTASDDLDGSPLASECGDRPILLGVYYSLGGSVSYPLGRGSV